MHKRNLIAFIRYLLAGNIIGPEKLAGTYKSIKTGDQMSILAEDLLHNFYKLIRIRTMDFTDWQILC